MRNVVLVGRIKYIADDYLIINLNNAENESCEVKTVIKGQIMEHVSEYCKVNDIVGVKGILSTDNGNETLHVVAEKITFLSASKLNEGGE